MTSWPPSDGLMPTIGCRHAHYRVPSWPASGVTSRLESVVMAEPEGAARLRRSRSRRQGERCRSSIRSAKDQPRFRTRHPQARPQRGRLPHISRRAGREGTPYWAVDTREPQPESLNHRVPSWPASRCARQLEQLVMAEPEGAARLRRSRSWRPRTGSAGGTARQPITRRSQHATLRLGRGDSRETACPVTGRP